MEGVFNEQGMITLVLMYPFFTIDIVNLLNHAHGDFLSL